MIKFGNITFEECDFNNINSLCYEPGICKIIHFNSTDLSDDEAIKKFKRCSENSNETPSIIKGGIILGCIVIVFIGIFASFMLINKRISEKNKKYLVDLLLNNNKKEVNVGINNNNINNVHNNNNNNNNNYNDDDDDDNVNNNYVMSDVSLSNSSYQESLNTESPPSYDESNIVIYADNDNGIVEENERPPEYSEINDLILK